jgi:hypothetical protein
MSNNPYDQFDSEAPQAPRGKLPPGPVSRQGSRSTGPATTQDPWAGFKEAPSDPWASVPDAPANLTPVDNDPFASQQGSAQSLPVITDDGSNWAAAPESTAKLTPVDHDPFDTSPHGQPTWSSSALSLLPISQYADGTYDWDSNAGMVGAAKRAGQSVLHSIENLPNLAQQVGAETAYNAATPQTAGQVANLAALTTSGDMMP